MSDANAAMATGARKRLSRLSRPRAERDPRLRGGRVGLGLNIIILSLSLAGLTGLTSSALFTDTEANPANTFSTSQVDLVLGSTSAFLTMPAMVPGDAVTAPLTVSNPVNNAAFRYSLRSVTTENTLAAQVQLSVKVGVTSCTNANFASSGTVLYNAGVLGSTGGTAVFGSPTTGNQAGDRPLSPGTSETLCFRGVLPVATSNAFVSLTTTATFTFDAEQTVNN